MKTGVLALQGAFREHREVLDALGVEAVEIRTPDQLNGIEALFLPGGESTTITRLLDTSGLRAPLDRALREGLPVFGSLECTVVRNGYGTQLDSFEAPLRIDGIEGTFPGVFIRAPLIEAVHR